MCGRRRGCWWGSSCLHTHFISHPDYHTETPGLNLPHCRYQRQLDLLRYLHIAFLKKKKKSSKISHISNWFQRDQAFYRCKHYKNATQKSVKDRVSGGLHGTGFECVRAGTKSQRGFEKTPQKVCHFAVIKANRGKDEACYQLGFQLASREWRKLEWIPFLSLKGEKKSPRKKQENFS